MLLCIKMILNFFLVTVAVTTSWKKTLLSGKGPLNGRKGDTAPIKQVEKEEPEDDHIRDEI